MFLLTYLTSSHFFGSSQRFLPSESGIGWKSGKTQMFATGALRRLPRRLPQYVDFADFALPRQAQDSQKASVVFQYTVVCVCVNRGVRFQSKIAQKNLKKPLDTFWKIASSNPSSQGQGSLECGSGFGFGADKDTVTMVLKSSAPSAMSRQSPSCLHHCLSRLSRFSPVCNTLQLQPIWPQGVLHFFLQISLLHPSCEAAALVCCTWWINNWLSSQRSESCFEWNWYESWINNWFILIHTNSIRSMIHFSVSLVTVNLCSCPV